MSNQQPDAQTHILVAGFGALGKLMLQQAPQCHWTAINRATSSAANAHLCADLLHIESIEPPKKIDFVVYTATPDARTPDAYEKTYILALKKFLYWLKETQVGHFFLISSTSVYGKSHGEWVDESSDATGATFSGQTIAKAEQLLKDSDLASTIIRFGGIYGPGREMLLRQVQQGVDVPSAPSAMTNRIHQYDCASVILHLMARHQRQLPLESCYVAVDDDGADKAEVYQYIAQQLGLEDHVRLLAQPASPLGKRCSNRRLKSTGYQFRYPSYKTGYGELIQEKYRV